MRFVASILYTVAAAVLVAVLLAFAGGGLRPGLAGVALGGGALLGAVSLWPSRRRPISTREVTGWDWVAFALFALCSLRAFLWVVFLNGDEIRILSPNNLGDLPLHLTYVRQLANGVPFWPENPILGGASLTYPLGVDLFHSLLFLQGLDLWRAFVWMGLAGSAMTAVTLWRWGRGFAILGFLANGGLLGWALLWHGTLIDYQAEHGWKSIFLALFVTQRGLLFAVPAGLALLASWRARWWDQATPESPLLPRWGEILLYAAMPIFHLHTFLALSFFLLAWFVLERAARREIAKLVGLAFLPASALVLLVTDRLRGPSLLGWHAGWMQDDPVYLEWWTRTFDTPAGFASSLAFWPLNFGLLPVVLGGLLWRHGRERTVRALVWPALALFALCCWVKFAVWSWDNTKLMIWAYLAVLPPLWTHGLARWPRWARPAGVLLLFGSGLISTLGGLGGTGLAIGSRHELEALDRALRGWPATTRFLGRPTYNHPLLMIGRPLAMGYAGHVSSHGYAIDVPQARIDQAFEGAPGWREAAAQTGCRYLFWGREEREAYPASPQPWRDTARLVATGDWGDLYDLAAPPEGAQTSGPQ